MSWVRVPRAVTGAPGDARPSASLLGFLSAFHDRQGDPEGGAGLHGGIEADVAVVGADDRLGSGEADPGTLGFGREIRTEDFGAVFRRNADTSIGDLHLDGPVFLVTADGELSAIGHGFEGVDDEIGEDAAQVGGMAPYQRNGGEIAYQAHAGGLPEGARHFGALFENLANIEGGPTCGARAEKFAHAGDHLRSLLHRATNDAEIHLALFGRRIHFHVEDFTGLADGVEHIVEVVRDTGSKLANGALPLGTLDVALQFGNFGDIARHYQGADNVALRSANRASADQHFGGNFALGVTQDVAFVLHRFTMQGACDGQSFGGDRIGVLRYPEVLGEIPGGELAKTLPSNACERFEGRVPFNDLARGVTDEGWIGQGFEQSRYLEVASGTQWLPLPATLHDPKIDGY